MFFPSFFPEDSNNVTLVQRSQLLAALALFLACIP